jgi:hypothetical protein
VDGKRFLILFLLGLLVACIGAWWIDCAGYMDADYYFVMGKILASDGGLTEPFLWNYLSDPAQIAHSGFQYWMPFTSLLAALGQVIFGIGFRAAQIPFILLVAFLPLFTAWYALRMHGDSQMAWESGLLALVPGFFLSYMLTTDSFSIFAYIGPLVFFLLAKGLQEKGLGVWLLAGILTGAAHLTRADGVLFLVVGLWAAMMVGSRRWKAGLLTFVGYLCVMGSWWVVRTINDGGGFTPGAQSVLWMVSYDELFVYPAQTLSYERWLQSGIGNILLVRLDALWLNIKSLLFVNGLVFLGPFMILGGWKLRRYPIVRLAALYLFLLVALMSFIFPLAGSRGGTFHSSMALMSILWVLAPIGLREAIAYGCKLRNWRESQARKVFIGASLAFAAIITIYLFQSRAIGGDYGDPGWCKSERVYEETATWLETHGGDNPVVAVNNPPGFYSVSEIPSVVIPDGGTDALEQVVRRFGVNWVLLDSNRPEGLKILYSESDSLAWLMPVMTIEDAQGMDMIIFKVLGQGGTS